MVGGGGDPRLAVAGGAFWLRRLIAGVLGLVLLATAGVVQARPSNRLDSWVADRTHRLGLEHPAWVSVSRFITTFGSATVLLPVVLVAVALLVLRRRVGDALLLIGLAVAASLSVRLAKAAFQRPRPHFSDSFALASGFAFPSGHATNATAIYGLIALLVLHALPGARLARRVVGSLAALVVLAIAASRVLLGVHWLSDVVAGLALGALWIRGALALRPLPPLDRPG